MIKEAAADGVREEAGRQEWQAEIHRCLPRPARLGALSGDLRSERAANKAWQNAEVELRQGRVGDPARGRQTFRKYVEEQWLPNHVLEPTTREKYTYYLGAHILPVLGPMRMADIFPEHIREWIARMQREGQSAWTIQYCKSSILSSIFTTALNDQVTYIHPCRGVKIPTVPATPRTIITPEQFEVLYGALPDADAQLLVETAIESGLRWGELTELRVRDLDIATRMLTVSRKVDRGQPGVPPRRRAVPGQALPQGQGVPAAQAQPADHREAQGPHQGPRPRPGRPAVRHGAQPRPHHCACVTESGTPGFTKPNDAGRRYRHGTLSAYNAGQCRCAHCRRRLRRLPCRAPRGPGRTTPQPRRAAETGTSTSAATGSGAWSGARPAKPPGWRICRGFMISGTRTRHGCSLAEPTCRSSRNASVTRRIMTTAAIPAHLPDADETAVEAFSRIRNRSTRPASRDRGGQREPPHAPGGAVRDRGDRDPGERQRARAQLRGTVRLGGPPPAHRLAGQSWPAEIDVFLAVGELALYVAYLDGWPARQRIWPWTTALTGLAVSIAGNIGHIQPEPGHPVILADRLTAATSPLAAFAGLSVGLLVLKMTRQRTYARAQEPRIVPALVLAPPLAASDATAERRRRVGGSGADLSAGQVT